MKKLKLLVFILFFLPLILTIAFSRPFPRTIFNLTQEEIYTINQRRGLYEVHLLGKLLENKPMRFLYKYKKNLSQLIDQNLYFFANHPRERAGVNEKQYFYWLFIIPFLPGLYYQIKNRLWWGIAYFSVGVLVISIFINYDRFIYYLLPFFVLTIGVGLWNVFLYLKLFIKK